MITSMLMDLDLEELRKDRAAQADDIALADWAQAGLRKPSVVKGVLARVVKTLVGRRLGRLSDADLHRTVTIRGEPHSVMQAINRQLGHYSYHCGQIVFLAKHLGSEHWKSLSIPRNASSAFNKAVAAGEKSQR